MILVTDFDPEEDAPAQDSQNESGDESDDGLAGTEHYIEVGYEFSYWIIKLKGC